MIGAFTRLAGNLALSNLLEAIETGVPVSPKQNMAAADAAYRAVFKVSGDIDGI